MLAFFMFYVCFMCFFFFFLGGGVVVVVTPLIPMKLCGGKQYFVEPGGSQTRAKRGVSGGFEPRFRGF